MAVFIYDKTLGRMVDKITGELMVEDGAPLATPMTFGDLPAYQSPIDGKWVDGRRARAYDMQSNNCIDANDFSKPKKLKNERFAKKYGMEHLLER